MMSSCSPQKNHYCWCFSPGAAPPPMNPMAPHTYQPSRAPYGPPPTGPPPTIKPTPPPTGPPVGSATPPPPKADGKFEGFFCNLGTFDFCALSSGMAATLMCVTSKCLYTCSITSYISLRFALSDLVLLVLKVPAAWCELSRPRLAIYFESV